jgi:pSer/pThr/pTyr-binding forkhead associated (FHA) protein
MLREERGVVKGVGVSRNHALVRRVGNAGGRLLGATEYPLVGTFVD